MKQTDLAYITPAQPRQLRLDTYAHCNASCLSCHRFLTPRKGEMSFDLIERIVDDAASLPIPLQEIVPVGYGEFFLRKDWFAILAVIARKLPGTRIAIPTNGSLFDDTVVQIIAKFPSVQYLNFSVNAYYEETYQSFMKLPYDTIAKIRKAIAQLRVLRPDIIVNVSMVFDPMYQSDLERDEFVNFWQPWVTQVWTLAAASCGREKKVLIPRISPCRSIFSDFVIGYDGKLSSCCWDSGFTLDLGSYSGSILKDWRNEKFEALRKTHNEHRRHEIELCNGCTYA